MTLEYAQWHGTLEELEQLAAIVRDICAETDNGGETCHNRFNPCAAHRMLSDQRCLNGLLLERRQRGLWLEREFMGPVPEEAGVQA